MKRRFLKLVLVIMLAGCGSGVTRNGDASVPGTQPNATATSSPPPASAQASPAAATAPIVNTTGLSGTAPAATGFQLPETYGTPTSTDVPAWTSRTTDSRTLVYTSTDGARLRADVYADSGPDKAPAVVAGPDETDKSSSQATFRLGGLTAEIVLFGSATNPADRIRAAASSLQVAGSLNSPPSRIGDFSLTDDSNRYASLSGSGPGTQLIYPGDTRQYWQLTYLPTPGNIDPDIAINIGQPGRPTTAGQQHVLVYPKATGVTPLTIAWSDDNYLFELTATTTLDQLLAAAAAVVPTTKPGGPVTATTASPTAFPLSSQFTLAGVSLDLRLDRQQGYICVQSTCAKETILHSFASIELNGRWVLVSAYPSAGAHPITTTEPPDAKITEQAVGDTSWVILEPTDATTQLTISMTVNPVPTQTASADRKDATKM